MCAEGTAKSCTQSTSLNRAGEPPVLEYSQAKALFQSEVDLVLPGQTAGYTGASAIIDLDGTVIREAAQ